jgi:CspA family cold shock protein
MVVQPDSGGKDVFVYISGVERPGLRSLNEGAKVSYGVVSNRGKEAAENPRAARIGFPCSAMRAGQPAKHQTGAEHYGSGHGN